MIESLHFFFYFFFTETKQNRQNVRFHEDMTKN